MCLARSIVENFCDAASECTRAGKVMTLSGHILVRYWLCPCVRFLQQCSPQTHALLCYAYFCKCVVSFVLVAQTTGFCSQGHPDVIHDDVANLTALFVGPTVAKTATSYINQLTQIESQGKMEPVKCLRKTADGRSVIDRGEWPNKSDIVMKGGHSQPLLPPLPPPHSPRNVHLCYSPCTVSPMLHPSGDAGAEARFGYGMIHDKLCFSNARHRRLSNPPRNHWYAGARTHVYTQTGAELSQGVEAAAVSGAHRIGAAVVLGAGNQPFLSIEDTLHMLFDRNLPVLLKHHPAQVCINCRSNTKRCAVPNSVPGPRHLPNAPPIPDICEKTDTEYFSGWCYIDMLDLGRNQLQVDRHGSLPFEL